MDSPSDEENREDAKMRFAMIGEQIRKWLERMWGHDGINYLFDDLLHNPDGSSVNRIIGAVCRTIINDFRYLNVDDKNIQDTFFKVEVVIKDDEGNEEKEEVETLDHRDFDFLSRSIVLAKILQITYPSMNPDELTSSVFQEEIIKDGRFVIGDGKLAESKSDVTSPQPIDLIMPKVPKKKEGEHQIIITENPVMVDQIGLSLEDSHNHEEDEEDEEDLIQSLEHTSIKLSWKDVSSPSSSPSSSLITLGNLPSPNYGNLHSFKPFDYPPQEPNTFQKLCEEFGKTMDFICEDWRNYLTEIDINKLDEALEDKDEIGIHLSLSHNLLNSTKEEEYRGYIPVFFHLETFFKMWTLFFLQKQNTCLIDPNKRIEMCDNLIPLVMELLKSHKARQEKEKKNDKLNEPENKEDNGEGDKMDIFSNYTSSSSSSPSIIQDEIINREERYLDAYHAVCDHFDIETDMFKPIFRYMRIIENIYTANDVTTDSAREAMLFEYPNPSRWWYDDEREEYEKYEEEDYDEDDKLQGREVVFKFLDYYCEKEGRIMEEWREEALHEARMLRELGDMGDMKVPKFKELVELDEFGLFALVMENGGRDIHKTFRHGIRVDYMIYVCFYFLSL